MAAFYDRASLIPLLLRFRANPAVPVSSMYKAAYMDQDMEGKTAQHWAVHRSGIATLRAILSAPLHLDAKGRCGMCYFDLYQFA